MFISETQRDVDELRFSWFGRQRLRTDIPESDTSVIMYYAQPDPDDPSVTNLMRRETRRLEAVDPRTIPGESYVLCPGVARLKFSFFDYKKKEWREDWSTMGADGLQYLPTHVRIALTIYDEKRAGADLHQLRAHHDDRAGGLPAGEVMSCGGSCSGERFRRRKQRERESGVALLMCISMLALLIALTSEFTYETSIHSMQAANARDEVRAHYLARSAVSISRLLIKIQQRFVEPIMRQAQQMLSQAARRRHGGQPAPDRLRRADHGLLRGVGGGSEDAGRPDRAADGTRRRDWA